MNRYSGVVPLAAILAAAAYGVASWAQKPTQKVGATNPSPAKAAAAPTVTMPPLERHVRLKPAYVSLTDLLKSIQDQTGLMLKKGDSVPEEHLFAASPGVITQGELRQIRLLLTDAQWQYAWANQKLNPATTEYLLWRAPIDPEQQKEYERQRVRDRLASLVHLLNATPAELDALGQEDPDTAEMLRQPIYRSWVALAGRLTPDQLNGVLAGHPLILPMSSLPADEKALVHQAAGKMGSIGRMDAQGHGHVLYDSHDLDRTGAVMFEIGKAAEPGALQLKIMLSSEPNSWSTGPGGDVLHQSFPDPFGKKAQMDAVKERTTAAALDHMTPRAKIVTIDSAGPLKKGESPFAAYLRSFAEQTGLTMLAYWPEDAKEPQKRIANSITRQPAAKALNALCKSYNCDWVEDRKVIRIRYKAADGTDEPQRENAQSSADSQRKSKGN